MITGEDQCLYHLGRIGERLGGVDLLPWLDELRGGELVRDLERSVADEPAWETKRFPSVLSLRLYRVAIYAIVRELKPENFIETGVLHGLTSAFILRALRANERGRLTSVDLPSYDEAEAPANEDGYFGMLPPGREAGWIVPPGDRERWDLVLGKSTDELPRIVSELGTVDIFLHDSEHTHETMTAEYEIVWEALAPGGLLISDNIEANLAFAEFAARVDRAPSAFPVPDENPTSIMRWGIITK